MTVPRHRTEVAKTGRPQPTRPDRSRMPAISQVTVCVRTARLVLTPAPGSARQSLHRTRRAIAPPPGPVSALGRRAPCAARRRLALTEAEPRYRAPVSTIILVIVALTVAALFGYYLQRRTSR